MDAGERICRDIQKDLLLFLDGDLPEREAARTRSHLAVCKTCRAEALALASLWRTEVSRPEPPADIWSRVAARMEAGRDGPRWLCHRQRLREVAIPALRLAGVIAAIWLGVVIGNLPDVPAVREDAPGEVARMFYLDAFDISPPGSIAAYLSRP